MSSSVYTTNEITIITINVEKKSKQQSIEIQ